MSAEKVRKLLGSLQDDPENEKAWSALDERALNGELAALGDELPSLLAASRRRFIERGEAEAAARMLDVEIEVAPAPATRIPLLRERAKLHEQELFDDQAAIKALDAVLSAGPDPEAAEAREALTSRKAKWKELVAAYKRHIENDTDPAMIARYLVSAAEVVLQYKGKGRDREVDTLFEQALSVDPGNVRAVQLYERILRRRGKWDELAAHLERNAESVQSVPVRVQMLFRAARTHAGHRNDIASAERLYRKVLQVEPGNAEATRYIVAILQDRERWDDLALFYEDQLRGGSADDVGLLVQVGMVHWRMRHDPDAARPYFTRLTALVPGHQAAAKFLAEHGEAPREDPSLQGVRDTSDPSEASDTERPSEPDVAVDHTGEEEIDGALDSGVLEDYAPTVPPVAAEAMEHVSMPAAAAVPVEALATVAALRESSDVAEERVSEERVTAERITQERIVQTETEVPTATESAVRAVPPEAREASSGAEASNGASAPEALGSMSAGTATRNLVGAEITAPVRPTQAARPAPAAVNRLQVARDMAQAAEVAGQTDRAIEGWKMVLRQDSNSAEARAALVRLYTVVGRWNNLVEMLRQELEALGGVRPGPEAQANKDRKLEILWEMVTIYRDRMALEPMVVQTYNAILGLEPGDRDALVALAASYEKLGRHTDVIKVLDQQAEHATDRDEKIGLLRRTAQIWLERFNNVNNATRPLEQVLTLDPTDVDAIGQLKELYARRRAWRPLFDVSRREVELLSGDRRRDAVVELAKLAAERLSSPSEAIALWREALSLDRNTPGALDALEKLTERERDYAGLAEVLERRADETSDAELKVAVLMKLGAVYGERLDDPARSVDAWKRVLATKPGHPKALRVLRDAYTQTAQWDTLEELYATAGDFEGLADVLGNAADRATEPATRIALSFRAARIYEDRLVAPERAFRSYERVLSVDPRNLQAATALVPIYLKEEKWGRLAQLYEILLDSLPASDVAGALGYLQKLRELAAGRLGDRAAAFRWAHRAYRLQPAGADLEATLEKAAAEAGAWRELVETFDARAAESAEPAERARLRDKAAGVEADRLNLHDAAIGRYQVALREAPRDAGIVSTLDRLLRRAERWRDLRDLFDHRLAATEGAESRRSLLNEVARLEEHQLADPGAASGRYRVILEETPGDPEALESLSRLAEAAGGWNELAGLLAHRRDAANGAARAELAFRLGDLRAQRQGDTAGAIESFREVLALLPHHAGALSALEGMLRDDAWRVTAARLLEPEFEAIGEHRKLAWALQILLETSTELDTRRGLALRLARVYSDRLQDPRSGFELVRSVLDEQPGSDELANGLADLASRGGWNDELATALARMVDRTDLDPDVRVRLARRTAAVYEDRHANSELAERFHRIVLDSGALDGHTFGALKRLYQERERWDDLRALYARWVERTPEVAARVELLQEEALVLEEILDQPGEATTVYQRILALDETNRSASQSLDRLLVRLGRWRELADVLTRAIALSETSAPDEARELTFRRGEVLEQHLGDPEGALVDFEAVVSRDGGHAGARAGLERLLGVPSLRRRAAGVLEPLYESDGDSSASDFVRMLLVRLEGTTEPRGRAELLLRVAEIRELVLNDLSGAFNAVVEANEAEPTSELLRAELLRLSAMAAADDRAAAALEQAAADPVAASVRVAILRDLAAVYDERLVDHGRAERTYRRLLEVAPGDTEVIVAAAVALERLYRGLHNARGLVEALGLRARHEQDLDLRRSLWAQAGEILEDELGDLPGAIAAQQERLAIDVTDRAALRPLARLYERTEAWTQIVSALRQDAALASDADEQKALLLRAAGVLEGRMADVPGAIALYTEILETFGADRAVHAALARLFEVSDAWPELLGVLERDLAVATDGADRLALIVRIAELRRLRTGDLARAVEGYKEALDIDPTQATARDALGALLRSGADGVALVAARALDPVVQAEQAWERLVEVLDRIAADTDDVNERRRVLARAADVCEIGLGDSGRAFGYAARELRESLGEPDLRPRFDHVERLAQTASKAAELATVLRDVAPELLDSDLQIDVFMQIAALAEGPLGDRATARAYYEKALDQRPDYLPALDALEALHGSAEAWSDLLAVLRRKTELATSDEDRRDLLRKQATISEGRLSDRPGAARAHEAILAIGSDRNAARALERIYAAEDRWDDLAQLLESQLASDGADPVDLNFRLGVVAMDHLGNPDRAMDHFRQVLDQTADHNPTVLALESLGQREGFAARTAEMLEPIYLARGDTPRLIQALEARIATETDVVSRKELLSRLGTLHEENLGDLNQALETYARVFREEVSDRGTWEILGRLARQQGRHDRLAEIFAEALEHLATDDDVTAELSFQTAQLLDQKVMAMDRARRYYRRALAFDPTRAEVFDALEGLLRREKAYPELLELYRDAAERVSDADVRKGYLFKIAEIDETALTDLPQAIRDYRAILETDPADSRAIDRLDALLVRTAAWKDLADLLERRVGDAVDSGERATLRFRLGRLRADRLDDAGGAVEAFREILDERRDHQEAMAALEQLGDVLPALRLEVVGILEPLYRELDDWRKLVVALNVRLAAANETEERGGLLREIGRIKETRAEDVAGSFAAFGQAFAADPGDGQAREAIERLAAAHGLWDDLVKAYEAALAATEDNVVRVDLLRATAVTHDQRRDDPRSAIEAYNRLFALDDSQFDVLDQLEGLHVLLSDWTGHVEVLERKVARMMDDDGRKFLLHQIGESQREALNNPDGAIDAYRRALEIDPGDVEALTALDALYAGRGDNGALAKVLTQRLEIEGDPDVRRRTALRLGRLWESELNDPQRAVEAYRRALDDGPTDRDAIVALERLYGLQEAWSDLLENLRTQVALATDDAARVPLRLRIGGLLAARLGDPDGALDTYREVLAVDRGIDEAITAVRTLAQSPEQRAAAVDILEPIFRSAGRWDDLVATLELKLTSIDDASQRLPELRGLAMVQEQGRGELASAFDTYRRALHEEPGDSETLADVERLAAALGRWSDLVGVLEAESEDASDPTVGRDLAVRAAQVAVQRLSDDARATLSYRRALDQGGDDDAILEPLDAIYSRTGQWNDLVEVLERRVVIATEPVLLDRLEVRVAELRETRFQDQAGALAAYRNVIDRTPDNAASLAGVERLLASASARADALDVLEGAYQRTFDNARLAWLLELRVQGADLASEKIRLLSDLARLREERLGDPGAAFDAMVQAFRHDPRDEQVLAEIERLAPVAGAWERLQGVVEAALALHVDLRSDEAAGLNLRAARWYHEHLGNDGRAEERLAAALSADPESADALEMVETLHRTPGRERDLVATLQRRAELELDVDARKAMLREAATLAEAKLGDTDAAAILVAQLLDVDDGDIAALDALARLRRAQGRHQEVAELLGRRARLVEDPQQALALRREVAELFAGPIGDPARAVMAYRDLLDFDPNDLAARTALEEIFERSGQWNDLDEALRGRLDVAVAAEERAAIRLKLAMLAESKFNSTHDAIEYLREILDELPTHPAGGRELERLYIQDQRWNELADFLERRSEDSAGANDTVGELSALVRIGELNEQQLRNLPRAAELYERVLDRNPDHVGALRALARLHEAEGSWDRAVEMLNRALSLSSRGADGAALALHVARLQEEHLGDSTATEQALRRALELDPMNHGAIDKLRAMAVQRNDPSMLLGVLELEVAIVTDARQQSGLLKALAELARDRLHDNTAAIGYLERAREIAPDDREILLPLVDLYNQSGRETDAVPILEQIIQSFGNRRSKEIAQWQHRLGKAFDAMGDQTHALANYDAAFKIDLTSVPILRDLGLLCLRMGDLERAQKSFRALLLQRLDGTAGITKADVYYYLGDTLAQQGDKTKAIGMLERALEADRSHTRALELVARLRV